MLNLRMGAAVVLTAAIALLGAVSPAAAQNLVGFNFTTATGAHVPQWNRITGIGTWSNNLDETGAATSVELNHAAGSFVSSSTLNLNTVPQYDYDLSNLVGYTFRSAVSGVSQPMDFLLSGLQANTAYEVWVVAFRASLTFNQTVTISNGGGPNVVFNQVGPGSAFVVNSQVGSNQQHWNSYAVSAMSSATGEMSINVLGNSGSVTTVGALAIRLVPGPGAAALLGVAALLCTKRRRRK